MEKRKPDHDLGTGALVKRSKQDTNGTMVPAVKRTSSLQAPIVQLSGHAGEVYAARFDPQGGVIASGSYDRSILLWRAFGDNQNFGVIKGSKGAILDLHWARDSQRIFTACTDTTLSIWDAESGARIKNHKGHTGVVNALDIMQRGSAITASASDDTFIGLWDIRQKNALDFLDGKFPVTCVAFDDVGSKLFSAGIEGDICIWDLRKQQILQRLKGHEEIVTSLSLSPDGQLLLSNAMDGRVRTWDVRPFAPEDRAVGIYEGAPAGLEKNLIKASWSSDGAMIAAGSGDQTVVIWDVASRDILYKLPGHRGCVNDVRFAPYEPVILSASSDRSLILGEIRPHGSV